MSSTTSRCFTIELDAIAILAASAARHLNVRHREAPERLRDGGKSTASTAARYLDRAPRDTYSLHVHHKKRSITST